MDPIIRITQSNSIIVNPREDFFRVLALKPILYITTWY
jgi:hypothetical protein